MKCRAAGMMKATWLRRPTVLDMISRDTFFILMMSSCGHHLIAVECISARSAIRHSSNEYESAAICVTVEVDGQSGSHSFMIRLLPPSTR